MYYTNKHQSENDSLNRADWQYTTISVPEDYRPYYQLYTGGQHQRFILSSPCYTRYWGDVEMDYYGTNILHNPIHWTVEQMPIAPIRSDAIETAKQHLAPYGCHDELNGFDKISDKIFDNAYYQYWATYFAKALIHSERSFLYPINGRVNKTTDWRIFPTNYVHDNSFSKYDGLQKQWKRQFANDKFSTKWRRLYNPDELICGEFCLLDDEDNADICPYIDWSYGSSYPLIFYHQPQADDGRVKWWRKKIRENSCPPLLVWFQEHLQGHLLIDGHARLQAYLLENQLPKVLTIANVQHQIFAKGEQAKQDDKNMLMSFTNNLKHGRKPMDVETINHLLIQAHKPNHDFYRTRGMGKPLAHMDSKWLREVRELAEKHHIDDVLHHWLKDTDTL